MTVTFPPITDLTLTVTLTEKAADRTGVQCVTRRYVGNLVRLIPAIEDLLTVAGVDQSEVRLIEVS